MDNNYRGILKLAERPTLWQRSQEPFWDDEHISKNMLEAHLSPNTDAASRKPEFIERSVAWLASLIKPGGSILDLGCGPGLYTKRLSDMGYKVTGIDLSKRSIEYAKAHDSKTEYICRDYLTLDLTSTYDAVTLIYCDFAALTAPEREKLLSSVRRVLKPDGLFIFDVFTDTHFAAKRESASWDLCEHGGFWSAERHLSLEATYLYENNTVAADRAIIITENGVKDYIIWDTAYTPERLARELAPCGLEVKTVYGDVCGKEYSESSQTLCCVAMRR